MDIRLNYADGNGAANGANWNLLIATTTITDATNHTDGLATAVDIVPITISPSALSSIGAGGSPCSGDAAWVDTNANQTGWQLNTAWNSHEFQDLDPAKTYTVEGYGLSSSGSNKLLETRCNGGTTDSIDVVQNFTLTTKHTGVSPDGAGTILFEFRDGGGGGWIGAARIVEETGPSVPALILDDDPQLGATLSGTYANFGGTPTGPIQIDQGARSLPDEAITVTAGTESWVTDTALPGLPANGASVTPFPLIGENITITLPDPGA